MNRIVISGFAAFVFALQTVNAACAQEYAVARSTAAAVIAGNDLDASRDAALSEAKKRCLTELLRSDLLTPADYQKHSQTLRTIFLDNPDPYIAEFAIENEEIIDDGQRYQVTARATVRKNAMNVALVEEGIEDVLAVGPKPTVMVLLRERFETRVSGTRMAETALINMLQEKGFKVIDPEQKKLLDLRNRLFAEGTGDMSALLQAAMSFKADYLMFGEAVVTSSGPLSGTDLKARYANMSLKIVEASSGAILSTATGSGKSKHIDELTGGNWALESAAEDVGKQVLSKFESILRNELLAGAEVLIDIHGLDYESQAKEVEGLLGDLENVASVSRRFYFSGIGQFEIRFKGGVSELAEALRYAEIDGQPLEILETLPRYIRVRRLGAQQGVNADVEQTFGKYLEEKYKEFDMERAREQDTELIAKINALTQSTKVNDEQKKQLYAATKEIEQKRAQVYYAQEELAKRTEEQRRAEAEKQRTEDKYENVLRELNDAKEDKRALQTQLVAEKENLRRELDHARGTSYTASRNYSNAQYSAGSSAGTYMSAISEGLNMANSFASAIGGLF